MEEERKSSAIDFYPVWASAFSFFQCFGADSEAPSVGRWQHW